MNLYLISQDKNNDYDTYDSAVVAAKSPQDAKEIHPSSSVTHVANGKWMRTYKSGKIIGSEYEHNYYDWVEFADIDCIEVEYLGNTKRGRGVVLSSFNSS